MQGCNSSRRAGGRGWAGVLPKVPPAASLPLALGGFLMDESGFVLPQPVLRDGMVLGTQLDAQILAAQHSCGDERGAGACERVERDASRRAEGLYKGQEHLDGFLGRVKPVAAVGPVDDIANGVGARPRGSFH